MDFEGQLIGAHYLGTEAVPGGDETHRGVDPRSGGALDPAYGDATPEQVDRALSLAAAAAPAVRRLGRGARAAFLEQAAQNLVDLGEPLLERASAETGLPLARLTGERGRTVAQLRSFAALVREGSYVGARIDHGDPGRAPLPKPDVRRMGIPLGPVVVFGASNFPLAFSVAGGDTASALAAGCPVVVKGHPNHPGTSEMVAGAMVDAARAAGMPEGIFSLLHGAGYDVGLALVRHPATRAVAFTGSLGGGRALFDAAASRPVPVPVYAEMGSSNPLFVLPGALAEGPAALAEGLFGSVTLGVGQFCTNPGLVFAAEGGGLDAFLGRLRELVSGAEEGTMLHAGIRSGYARGTAALASTGGVELLAGGGEGSGACGARPAVFVTDGSAFLAQPALSEEVFGPSTLVVRCADRAEMVAAARTLGGQLTASLHAAEADLGAVEELLPILDDRVGRVVFGGYPTGVEVCPAMQHGGPYPATSDSRSTSVGTAAVDRFLRPVAYQDAPAGVLPEELQDGNPAGIWRLVDGEHVR